jgi:hypothetical protein
MRRLVDGERLGAFLRALGRAAEADGRVYLTGGATAVLLGWRPSTIDVDIKIAPEQDRLLRALPELKEQLQINVELAAPDQFIPELPGWQDRSPFVLREGRLSFHHYDLYAQALAKIERGHAQDVSDVQAMLDRRLIERERLGRLFQAIETQLYQFPAIDPVSFRRAVEEVTGPLRPSQKGA